MLVPTMGFYKNCKIITQYKYFSLNIILNIVFIAIINDERIYILKQALKLLNFLKTSLTPLLFIEVSVPSQENECCYDFIEC